MSRKASDMSERNLNPHAEARAAMAIWSHEYAYEQKGGSMDFWDTRTAGQKETCVKFVDEIRRLPRADGTPAPQHISMGDQPATISCRFGLGDRVRKTKGSSWQGRIVGFYSTALTPVGYAVESEREPGSVQIYPETALAKMEDQP